MSSLPVWTRIYIRIYIITYISTFSVTYLPIFYNLLLFTVYLTHLWTYLLNLSTFNTDLLISTSVYLFTFLNCLPIFLSAFTAYLSLHISCFPIYLSVYLLALLLSISIFHFYSYQPTYLFTCLLILPSLFTCLFAYLSIHLLFPIYIHPSTYQLSNPTFHLCCYLPFHL